MGAAGKFLDYLFYWIFDIDADDFVTWDQDIVYRDAFQIQKTRHHALALAYYLSALRDDGYQLLFRKLVMIFFRIFVHKGFDQSIAEPIDHNNYRAKHFW